MPKFTVGKHYISDKMDMSLIQSIVPTSLISATADTGKMLEIPVKDEMDLGKLTDSAEAIPDSVGVTSHLFIKRQLMVTVWECLK